MVPDDEHCSKKEINVISYLDKALNITIFLLIFSLLFLITKELYVLIFLKLFQNGEIGQIVDLILFIFILIELFTILVSYLKKGYIKVERIVEVGIISIVRDIIFHVDTIETTKIYSISAVLLVLGGLFFIEKRFSKDRNK